MDNVTRRSLARHGGIVLGLGLLGSLVLGTGTVAARDGDVIRTGSCARASDWKLKLSNEDGQLEIEFEVDQNVVGDRWHVRIKEEGILIFDGHRRTQAPSGSFEVNILTRNRAGIDDVIARAVNERTGEVCRGTASF